jgi:hypothetical protein
LRYGTGSDETVSRHDLEVFSQYCAGERYGADGTNGNVNDDTNDGTDDRPHYLAA